MGTERWSSLFWILIGLAICVGSLRLGMGTLHSPGPGFLPFFAGLILGILGLIVFTTTKTSLPENGEKTPMFVKGRVLRVVLTMMSIMCYAVAMEYFGFLISTVFFLLLLLKVIEPQRWAVATGASILGALGSYLIFEVLLECQLPQGHFFTVADIWQAMM